MYDKIAKFTSLMVENRFDNFIFETIYRKITVYKTERGRRYPDLKYVIGGFRFIIKTEKSYIVDFYLMDYLRDKASVEGLECNLEFSNSEIIFSFSDPKIQDDYIYDKLTDND